MKAFRIALILLSAAVPLAAQQRGLERIDSLIASGRAVDARTALGEWERANQGTKADAAQRARALYLTARLTEDAAQAQDKYLSVTLTYPTSREAPDALLRLGQGLLANGEAQRATGYFERLLRDYPKAPARPQAYLWLSRAQLAAGNARAACTTATSAGKNAQLTSDIREQIAEEEKTACATPAERQRSSAAPTVSSPPALPGAQPASSRSSVKASAEDARFAVQTAAFRELRNADAAVDRLRKLGFDARVVLVESNSLARVRVGHFSTSEQAAAELQRMKAANIDGIIVTDVQNEKSAH